MCAAKLYPGSAAAIGGSASGRRKSIGELVGEVLHGAWRCDPPPLDISGEELRAAKPLIARSGAAALTWRRLRTSHLAPSPAAAEFHQRYRLQTLQARLDQSKVAGAVTFLRSVGVEPMVIKGWAIARLYPEQGVRPYGDIDVCVRRAQYAIALAALRTPAGREFFVDLHDRLGKLGGGHEDALYDRSQLVRLGGTDVRVLGPEDHLRVLCFHLLQEGAWRPLWLCDVAVALETRPPNFDWEVCFGGQKRSRDIVCCAIGLSGRLLGAEANNLPWTPDAVGLPRWMVPTVLKEWSASKASMMRRYAAPMASYRLSPSRVIEGLRDRWPNALEATMTVQGPMNNVPRLPFQIGSYVAQSTGFLMRELLLHRDAGR